MGVIGRMRGIIGSCRRQCICILRSMPLQLKMFGLCTRSAASDFSPEYLPLTVYAIGCCFSYQHPSF